MTVSYSTPATAIPVGDMKEEVLRIEYYINGLPVMSRESYQELAGMISPLVEKMDTNMKTTGATQNRKAAATAETEEAIGEYGEEEGEYIPPGYQAADGPFKSYCTCGNFVTCSFCSWFYKIKQCKRHGQATRRPFKPCTCPSSARDDEEKPPSFEELQQSLETLTQPTEKNRSCLCAPKIPETAQCDCLAFLEEKPTEEERLAENLGWQSVELDDEYEEEEVDAFEGDFVEEDGEWEMLEDGGPVEEHEETSERKRGSKTKNEGIPTVENTCTCEIHPPPRSGSSTEIETDSDKSTLSSSLADLNIGEGYTEEDDANVLTSSEESSAECSPFDPTRIKWVSYASDRSVDSITEDELDESEIDRIAAHWGIRNIYGRRMPSAANKKEKPPEKPSKGPKTRKYLVVQHNRTKVSNKTCKKKKDRPNPYYYRLMEL